MKKNTLASILDTKTNSDHRLIRDFKVLESTISQLKKST